MRLHTRRTFWALGLLLGASLCSWLGWGAQAERADSARRGSRLSAASAAHAVSAVRAAAAIPVNSTADGTLAALSGNGFCELREAIEAANTNAAVDACPAGMAGADTITFSVSGMIT